MDRPAVHALVQQPARRPSYAAECVPTRASTEPCWLADPALRIAPARRRTLGRPDQGNAGEFSCAKISRISRVTASEISAEAKANFSSIDWLKLEQARLTAMSDVAEMLRVLEWTEAFAVA